MSAFERIVFTHLVFKHVLKMRAPRFARASFAHI